MKKLTLSTLCFFILFISYGQTGANRALSSFNAVSAQEGIDVYLTAGDTETARIEAEGIDMEDVLTEVSDGILRIHLDGNNHGRVDVRVYVTYTGLKALSASSAASIQVADELKASDDFAIKASSSGSVELTLSADQVEVEASSSGDVRLKLTASRLNSEVSSAGDIDVKGKVDHLGVRASSSGDFEGSGLTTKSAEAQASSGASVKFNVLEDLKARASSGASIRYQGDPKNVNADSSSGGTVRKF